jgi:hypothetical protein
LRVILFFTTGLCFSSVFEIMLQSSTKFTSMAIAVLITGMVTFINLIGPIRIRAKSQEELKEKEAKLKLGAFYADLKHDRRMFSAYVGIEKIVLAALLGALVANPKVQISVFLGFSIFSLIVTVIFKPFKDAVFHNIKVSVKILRIVQISLTFLLIFATALVSPNAVGYAIIALNCLTLLLFVAYGVYRIITEIKTTLKSHQNPVAVLSNAESEQPKQDSLIGRASAMDSQISALQILTDLNIKLHVAF